MIRFDCVHCGAHLEVPDEMAGKDGTCPLCGKKVPVPLSKKQEADSSGVPPVPLMSGTGPSGGAVTGTYGPTAARGGTGTAVAALVLGISAIVIPILGVITGVIAIALGSASLRKPEGKGMAVAGIITGSIGALIGVVAALVTILVPVITSSIADSHRVVCATKLGTIADSFSNYDDDPQYGGFPRLAAKGDPDDVLKDGNTLDAATLGTNTMQSVWLLVDAGYLPASAFRCPADEDYEPKSAMTRYGWGDYRQFSYGMQNPYDADADGDPVNRAVPVSTRTYKGNYVFFADMNPGGPASLMGHSNHPDGCNVATRNGNVSFHEDKGSSLVYGEEIYDDDADPDDAWPDSSTDVVITPTDPKGNR